MKVAVTDVNEVPKITTVTGTNLLVYHVWLKVTEVVEVGWLRNHEDNMLDFDSIEDEDMADLEEGSEPKRQKVGNESGSSTPNQQVGGGKMSKLVQAQYPLLCKGSNDTSILHHYFVS
jgi:hypothetical protein